MSREAIGHFELLVLSAILRLEDRAYGTTIAQAIEEATGRDVLVASIYAALERLETKGLTASRLGEATPERGGRAKRFITLTSKGVREVQSSRRALTALWTGVRSLQGARA